MKVVLVEPEYYSRFPPIGLLKIAAYHKEKGNEVEYVKGCNMFVKGDVIDITSLFTYEWKEVWKCVEFYKNTNPKAKINLGGIYASLMPEHAAQSGARVYRGLISECEEITPDYSFFPSWEESIVYSSRGCVRKCEFCGVRIVEPKFTYRKSIKKFVLPDHKKVTFFDNNFLANPYWENIVEELCELNKIVEFNQGLDIRLLTEEKAKALSKLKIDPVRFAFDSIEYKDQFIKGIELAKKYELDKSSYFSVYILYNFLDKPEDLIERIKICNKLGVRMFLMKYSPIDLLDKEYIGKYWTLESLEKTKKLEKLINKMGTINPASYMYLKIPLPDYIENLDILWNFQSVPEERNLFTK